ncbi:UbiX family flavin prenyltransferase [Anaplasma bovis]|uniref:UbiX family flavin prenyltransferase n=1 Tax=Anaplasma bovis TaxID=186733 RepID=UPI002FEEC413
MNSKRRIVVGISGASGAPYAVQLLKQLKNMDDVEVHLVMSDAAQLTIKLECPDITSIDEIINSYCAHYHKIGDVGASIASGSFKTEGMIVIPCSIRTMSEIAHGINSNLLTRAADVVMKEKRKLILAVRETPLHLGHLRTMVSLTEMGAIIAPPVPSFYNNPKSLSDIVHHYVSRILGMFNMKSDISEWKGL